jgi:hypothetical protein
MALIAPTRASIAAMLQKEVGVSHSQLENFQRCPRRWGYEKILGQRPAEDREALVFGGAGHSGLEVIGRGATRWEQAWEAAKAKIAAEAEPGMDLSRINERLPLHLQGFLRLFWPRFLAEYEVAAVEQPAKYLLHENIYWRGTIDLIARQRATGLLFILDYKFSSDSYIGNLTGMMNSSPQLSAYTMATVRSLLGGQWPGGVGYIFLQKLRKNENPQNLVNDVNKYQLKTVPISPDAAAFAVSAERNTALLGAQVKQHFVNYANHGLAAIDMLPAHYGGCNIFNSWCGFCEGCLKGRPLHTEMKEAS